MTPIVIALEQTFFRFLSIVLTEPRPATISVMDPWQSTTIRQMMQNIFPNLHNQNHIAGWRSQLFPKLLLRTRHKPQIQRARDPRVWRRGEMELCRWRQLQPGVSVLQEGSQSRGQVQTVWQHCISSLQCSTIHSGQKYCLSRSSKINILNLSQERAIRNFSQVDNEFGDTIRNLIKTKYSRNKNVVSTKNKSNL